MKATNTHEIFRLWFFSYWETRTHDYPTFEAAYEAAQNTQERWAIMRWSDGVMLAQSIRPVRRPDEAQP